jgi:hypothetical protein
MAVTQFDATHGSLGPILGELERHGCTLRVVDGPTATGRLVLHVLFPDDEYLEKRCRRLLDQARVA